MMSQGGTSRLTQMKMRFQQKQQQEREQRKIEVSGNILINKNGSITNIIDIHKKSNDSSAGTGKVRQMFDERRQRSTGIDKSYPLKPISLGTSANSESRTIKTFNTQKQISTTIKQMNCSTSNINTNNNSDLLQYDDDIQNETFPTGPHFALEDDISQPLNTTGKFSILNKNRQINDDKNNNSKNSINNATNLTLKPVLKKKSPSAIEPSYKINNNGKILPLSSTNNRNKHITSSSSNIKSADNILPSKAKTKPLSTHNMNDNKNFQETKNSTENEKKVITNKSVNNNNNNNGLSNCRICGRGFNPDRIEKHEKICEKSANKKRKKYDAVKHRVAGTEAEKYVKRNIKTGTSKLSNTKKSSSLSTKTSSSVSVSGTSSSASASSANKNANNKSKSSSNWRKVHEDFINTIRAAKQMQAHLAKGGKLSDLPPPPPTENLDYIQCPHCSRKFNQHAAERHIPKCANFRHNKSKTSVTSSRKRI